MLGEVVGDADGDTGAAVIDRDQCRDARADALLHGVDRGAQVFGIQAFDHLAKERVAADLLGRCSVGLGRASAHCERLLRVGELALEALAVLYQGRNPRRHFIRGRLEHRRCLAQLGLAGRQPLPRRLAGQRFEAANSRRDRAFADNLEQLDVAQRVDMRAAAQLHAVIILDGAANAQDTHLVAVFFAEQRHRAGGNRFVGSHQPRRDRRVGADLGIHFGFDRGDVVRRQCRGVREIEAQAIGGDQAAFLGDVIAEAMAQCGVEQMGGAVIGADSVAAF